MAITHLSQFFNLKLNVTFESYIFDCFQNVLMGGWDFLRIVISKKMFYIRKLKAEVNFKHMLSKTKAQ